MGLKGFMYALGCTRFLSFELRVQDGGSVSLIITRELSLRDVWSRI